MSSTLAVELGKNRFGWISDKKNSSPETWKYLTSPFVSPNFIILLDLSNFKENSGIFLLDYENRRVRDAFSWKATLKQPVIFVNAAGENACGLLKHITEPSVATPWETR